MLSFKDTTSAAQPSHSDMNAKAKFLALSLILLSFTLCSVLIGFAAGVSNTPFSATDGAGRRMGFNDSFSPEHYAIAFSGFRVETLFSFDYAYSWLLLGMHGWAARLILRQSVSNVRRMRRFLAAQAFIFPIGWIGLFILPATLRSVFHGTLDREGIIDVPFVALNAHPIWLITAMVLMLSLPKVSGLSAKSDLLAEPQVT